MAKAVVKIKIEKGRDTLKYEWKCDSPNAALELIFDKDIGKVWYEADLWNDLRCRHFERGEVCIISAYLDIGENNTHETLITRIQMTSPTINFIFLCDLVRASITCAFNNYILLYR